MADRAALVVEELEAGGRNGGVLEFPAVEEAFPDDFALDAADEGLIDAASLAHPVEPRPDDLAHPVGLLRRQHRDHHIPAALEGQFDHPGVGHLRLPLDLDLGEGVDVVVEEGSECELRAVDLLPLAEVELVDV